MMSEATPANTTQLPATDATIPQQQQQPELRTLSTCSSSFSSVSVCKDTEILTMKSTVSHLKNENYELTENIHRQNMAFISWQNSVDEELEYLQKEVLSSRQNKKYQAWKQERRKRNTLELEAKVEKIEKSDIGLSMGDVSCGLLQNSGKIDLDKSNMSHCSVDEKGSSVSLDKIHNDRQMLLDLRIQRDQLLTDKEALAIQYSNSQQFSNSEHEQITALQNQVEELRQTALYLMDEMQRHEYEKVNLNGGSLEIETESQDTVEETTLHSLESLVLADADNSVTNIE
jgi:hypothetical protein